MINIKKLVALDMTLNGKWLILTEFVVGTFGILALAYLLPVVIIWKLWLVGVSVNYLPLALYASRFVFRNNYTEIVADVRESETISRYNKQQWLTLIPFFIALVSIIQLFHKNSSNIIHPVK